MNPPRAVAVTALRKSYGDTHAVADVSLTVETGEIVGILGPNGSGKTTTVECIQGLRRADGGSIEVFGHDPRVDERAVRALVGSQLQESALPDRLRVWEALHLFSTLAPGGPDWRQLLADWGLQEHRDQAFGDLSGGQQQRLLVALALVNDPPLVFLDEMTTGLDPAARRVAWELIGAVRDRGTTVVLVTHFMDEAERLCDRLVVIAGGRVVAEGTPRELVAAHTSGATVRFTIDADGSTEAADDLDGIRRIPGVADVARVGDAVTVTGTGPLLARVAHALVERGHEPEDLRVELPTLEEVYLGLVGDAEVGAAEVGA